MDKSELKSAIPSGLLADGDAAQITNWFGQLAMSATVPVAVHRSDFLKCVAGAIFRIGALTDPDRRQEWRDFLSMAQSVEYIDVQLFAGVMAMAVAQGVLLQSEVDTLNGLAVRTGSNAESLFGASTIVTVEQVQEALDA